MDTLEQISHVDRGLSRLTSRFAQTNYQKFLTAYLTEFDTIEQDLMDIAGSKDLSTVNGVWLDFLGKWMGVDRLGRTDTAYRAALLLTASSATASGTPDQIISAVKDYTNTEDSDCFYAENIMAFFTIRFATGDDTQNMDSGLIDLLEDIKPAGVSYIVATDYGLTPFVPAWLISSEDAENFQVTYNGTDYLSFYVSADGSSYDLFYTLLADSHYFDSSTENAIPAWESDEDSSATYDKDIYCQWEITSDTNSN